MLITQEGIDVMADSKAERKELRLRAISSVGIVAVILGAIYYGSYAWPVVAGIIALMSLSEYYRLVNKLAAKRSARISPGVGYIIAVIFFFAALQEHAQAIVLAMLLTLCVFGVFIVEIVRRQLTKVTLSPTQAQYFPACCISPSLGRA